MSARKRLYEELLLMNLSEEMGGIGEAEMLQEIIMRMKWVNHLCFLTCCSMTKTHILPDSGFSLEIGC